MKQAAWWMAGVATGVVLGFLAATAGAGAAMREMTAERDETRDRLTASMQQLMDTAADSLQNERQKATALQKELDRVRPKQVKGDDRG